MYLISQVLRDYARSGEKPGGAKTGQGIRKLDTGKSSSRKAGMREQTLRAANRSAFHVIPTV
jgi:hypothetical protein